MRVASLDLGSNTFILTIVEQGAAGEPLIICDEVRYVRLGQGVDKSRKFHPDALKRASEALTEFAAILKAQKPVKVLATATSAARDVTNGDELLELCESLDIPVKIISGDEEAELTFLGSRFFQRPNASHWVIDIGGGSTEVILGGPQGIIWRHSFDLGCVRLLERCGYRHGQIEAEINREFARRLPQDLIKAGNTCIAVAGTPVELVRLLRWPDKFFLEACEGFNLSASELESCLKIVTENLPQVLVEKFGTPKGRADVLLVGVILLIEFFKHAQLHHYVVSRSGIRYGVIQSLWS